MKKIIAIVGARPQFIKHIAIERAFEGKCILKTIHTGQHYDENLSDIFFKQLQIKKPDYQLQPSSSSTIAQLADMMEGIGNILIYEKPDIVIVYGDTNSTISGAIAAEKLNIPIAHVEAGLRSFNRNMPEEINRILTDKTSTYLFVPNEQAAINLRNENIGGKIYVVGDIMKDCVHFFKNLPIDSKPPNNFIYFTIHRNYNTESKERLSYIFENVNRMEQKIIFPIHPRTKNLMKKFDLNESDYSNIEFITPLSYLESLQYLKSCDALITDSGGMQKEAYFLQKRCITIRSETEWKETLKGNWNQLCFDDLNILKESLKMELGEYDPGLYGDGKTSIKIEKLLSNI